MEEDEEEVEEYDEEEEEEEDGEDGAGNARVALSQQAAVLVFIFRSCSSVLSPAHACTNVLNMSRERLSHALSKVLRHTANAKGIGVGADGFCSVRELLELQVFKALSCSVADIVDVVENSNKKRFQLSGEPGELMVRAVQGHSMSR